jgi:hypothetical protein
VRDHTCDDANSSAAAQLAERVRRIGVLTTRDETDPVTKLQVSAVQRRALFADTHRAPRGSEKEIPP